MDGDVRQVAANLSDCVILTHPPGPNHFQPLPQRAFELSVEYDIWERPMGLTGVWGQLVEQVGTRM